MLSGSTMFPAGQKPVSRRPSNERNTRTVRSGDRGFWSTIISSRYLHRSQSQRMAIRETLSPRPSSTIKMLPTLTSRCRTPASSQASRCARNNHQLITPQ